MKVSNQLATVLRQVRREVDAWPKWKRSVDPQGTQAQKQKIQGQAKVQSLQPETPRKVIG